MVPDRHTIAAVATPPGKGGIGIIKVSGRDAIRALERVFAPGKKPRGAFRSDWKFTADRPRSLLYGRICDPSTGEEIDEVLVSIMKGPNSYTGEDVVEINAHGGPRVLTEILELVLSNGVREAKPGEFTFRAFLNGKIDLTKAEAICDLINAKGQMAAKAAARQLQGEIQAEVNAVRGAIITLLADIEARIEFPDELDSEDAPALAEERVQTQMIRPIRRLIDRHDQFRSVLDGAKVVIAGKSNVGKSSLLNALSCSERAIVTPVPGTTRDTVEVEMELGGTPVTLIDTAGIRQTLDPVEAIGIERTRQKIDGADLILWVIDVSRPIEESDRMVWEIIEGKRSLIVGNKADLPPSGPESKIEFRSKGSVGPLMVSARYQTGIEGLKKKIIEGLNAHSFGLMPNSGAVPNRRHRRALDASLEFLKKVEEGLGGAIPWELVCYDLKAAKDSLEEITGENQPEAVYEKIFSQFCIGK